MNDNIAKSKYFPFQIVVVITFTFERSPLLNLETQPFMGHSISKITTSQSGLDFIGFFI